MHSSKNEFSSETRPFKKKKMNTETLFHLNVTIPLGQLSLPGILTIPEHAKGLIIFVHGSGSSRLSPRNNKVAEELNENGFATFLFDLLSEVEDREVKNRFDIRLLTERLIIATGWVIGRKDTQGLEIGYFGASTGAAAALCAASRLGHKVKVIVSRGGRPDLAMSILNKVNSPVLLIVGELDNHVMDLNLQAYMNLSSKKAIRIISGASHLFEESGTLDLVSKVAMEWFDNYLIPIEN